MTLYSSFVQKTLCTEYALQRAMGLDLISWQGGYVISTDQPATPVSGFSCIVIGRSCYGGVILAYNNSRSQLVEARGSMLLTYIKLSSHF